MKEKVEKEATKKILAIVTDDTCPELDHVHGIPVRNRDEIFITYTKDFICKYPNNGLDVAGNFIVEYFEGYKFRLCAIAKSYVRGIRYYDIDITCRRKPTDEEKEIARSFGIYIDS